jgi:transporter family protein
LIEGDLMLAKIEQNWILLAVFSSIGWGVWGFFSGRASKGASPIGLWASVVIIEGLIAVPALFKVRPVLTTPSVLAAVSGVIGYLLFFVALKQGKAPTVVAITALYPMVTLIITVFASGYKPSARELIGIGVAIFAVYLLAG